MDKFLQAYMKGVSPNESTEFTSIAFFSKRNDKIVESLLLAARCK